MIEWIDLVSFSFAFPLGSSFFLSRRKVDGLTLHDIAYTPPNSTTNITITSETKYTVNMTQYAPKSPCRFYVNDTQERREYTKTALLYIVSNGSTAEPVTWSVDRQAPSLPELYQDEVAEGAASVIRGMSAMLAVGVGLVWGFVVIL